MATEPIYREPLRWQPERPRFRLVRVLITWILAALALSTCCGVSHSTAVDYSTAQQLITTAWNIVFALVTVVAIFGWTGGKSLVLTSYEGAKEKAAEQKEARAARKEAKRAAKHA